ncbi:MAG: phosphoenolpyruvate--protein phosphotransferase [Flavobacteriaceae bacterium]
MKTLKGIVASSGIAIGKAKFIVDNKSIEIFNKYSTESEAELIRFRKAIIEATKKNRSYKKKIFSSLSSQELEIYDAYESIINDPDVIDQTIEIIKRDKFSAAFAYFNVAQNFINELKKIDDPYLKQRAQDIEMISKLVIEILENKKKSSSKINIPSIIVAEKINPNTLAELESKNLIGLITSKGGLSDHTSIIAKAMGVPYLINVENASEKIKNGDFLIIDSNEKSVKINPEKETILKYKKIISDQEIKNRKQVLNSKDKAFTKSGKTINIMANVGSVEDGKKAFEYGADGIGLLRTELCFINSSVVPEEETHYKTYKKILETIPEKKCTLRLLDFGADKKVSYLPVSNEQNPAIGNRALRLGFMNYESLLKPQIRSFLRLSKIFEIKILCPMITTPDDLIQVIDAIKQEQEELKLLGEEINEIPKIGIMVEVPNVAINPLDFVSTADFFSFGTNDLAQFLMAADRTNEMVSHYLEQANQTVVKLIKDFAKALKPYKKEISICGELASNQSYLKEFIDLGLSSLSVTPSQIPKIKTKILSLK